MFHSMRTNLLEKVQSGEWAPSVTDLVGNFQRGREGLAHTKLRAIFEQFELAYYNSFFDAGSTYWHWDGANNRIDLLAGPLAALDKVSHCGVSKKQGRLLQYIEDVTKLRDHLPLITVVEQTPACAASLSLPDMVKWDWNSIMQSWQAPGVKRNTFVEKVESTLEALKPDLHKAYEHGTPDHHWQLLGDAVLEVAKNHFTVEVSESEKARRLLSARRVECIKERALLRQSSIESLGKFANVPPEELSQQERQDLHLASARLKAATNKCRAMNRLQHVLLRDLTVSNLIEAWNDRHMSECWRHGRYLAAQSRGPKKRRYGLATTCRPTAEEYETFFAAHSSQGGMSAIPQDWQK